MILSSDFKRFSDKIYQMFFGYVVQMAGLIHCYIFFLNLLSVLMYITLILIMALTILLKRTSIMKVNVKRKIQFIFLVLHNPITEKNNS